FRGVVLAAELCSPKQQPQNLRVRRCRPPSSEIQKQENENAAEETAQEIEGCSAKAHCEKEELSLRSEDGERPGKRTLHGIDASLVVHGSPLHANPVIRER